MSVPSELEIRSKDRTVQTTIAVDEAVLMIVLRLLDPAIRKDINYSSYGQVTINYGNRPDFKVKVALTRHY